MGKLAEILHDLIAGAGHLTDNRRGELHVLVDELADELLGAITETAPADPQAPANGPATP